MLRLLGIKLSPAVRALMGLALAGIGVGTHRTWVAVIGGALVAWSLVGLVVSRRADGANHRPR